jgi:hypothetical protein
MKIAEKSMKHRMKIKRDGTIEWLAPPPVPFIIEKQIRKRFSEIVPVNPLLLVLFRLLRWMFGENGAVSDWTRRWKCTWSMTILKSGFTCRSNNRQSLVDIEHELFFKPKLDESIAEQGMT